MLQLNLDKKVFSAKNTFRCLGIIVMLALVGFSSCKKDEKIYDPISITITGNFSEYTGWKATIALCKIKGDNVDVSALGFPLNFDVTETTTSLDFTMVTTNLESFNKPGTYLVMLSFEKEETGKEKEKLSYAVISKSINEGSNSMEFSTFDPF